MQHTDIPGDQHHQSNNWASIIPNSFRCIELREPGSHPLIETPSYIQVIDSSRSLTVIDARWSTAVIAISLIPHPIPQKVIGLEPEATKHEQFQRGGQGPFRARSVKRTDFILRFSSEVILWASETEDLYSLLNLL